MSVPTRIKTGDFGASGATILIGDRRTLRCQPAREYVLAAIADPARKALEHIAGIDESCVDNGPVAIRMARRALVHIAKQESISTAPDGLFPFESEC